jgi:2-dehydro-3-deoxyphosphooctonate aldolase (KDO 8-P synthase)
VTERLTIVAGPCVLESREHALEMAWTVSELVSKAGFALTFKASFDKANRTSGRSFRGPGLKTGIEWLARVKQEVGVPVLTDIHEPEQARPAAEVADVLQIPAFLCRQTDLIVAAGQTGRAMNLKKGQFMAPPDMAHAVGKARDAGAGAVTVTERGVSFGYHNLVVDFRSIPWIQSSANVPVWFDGTHSAQLPAAAEGASGGDRRFVPQLCRAALAAGCDGLFLEVHSDPSRARSDAATQLSPAQLADLLESLVLLWPAANELRRRWSEDAKQRSLWEWTS